MSDSKWQEKMSKTSNHGDDAAGQVEGDVAKDAPSSQTEAHTPDLGQELEKVRNQMLLIAAEYDNYRKRSVKELEDAKKYAMTKFAQDMVDVLENLYRSELSIKEREAESEDLKPVLDGVQLTIKSFVDMLSKHGIQRIYPQGVEFDHNFHEAISRVPSSTHPAGMVIETIGAGYTIGDRLLRPALVVVSADDA
jgi:molecular chaperone GrpE